MKNQEETRGKRWLKREMRPYRPSVCVLAAVTVAATLLSLAFSYLIRFVINAAADGDKKRLLTFAAVCAIAAFLRVALQIFKSYYTERCRAKITVGLRGRILKKTLRAEYAETQKYHSGDLLNRLTSDVAEIANTGVSILPAVTGMCVQCAGATCALFLLDPLFTAIFTVGGILIAIVSVFFRRATKKYHKRLTEADGESRSFIQEAIASLMTVKAYGAEEKTAKKSEKLLDGYFFARMKKNALSVAIGGSFSLLSTLSTVFAVVWCSLHLLSSGSGDYGAVFSVIMLLGQLQQPFTSFSAVLPACYARDAAAERLSETEERAEEVLSSENAEEAWADAAAIRLKDVRFAYQGREDILLGGDVRILMNKITCVTGRSGSGKSTLFKLLLCVYKAQSGGLFWVDETGKETPIEAVHRGAFAYVPQGNFLFSGTIYENLTFFAKEEKDEKSTLCGDGADRAAIATCSAREKKREKREGNGEKGAANGNAAASTVSESKIREALETACATFVYDLPNGLETRLGERGNGLSEGQLQRLAVARALLSERPVLLLDEATSALDDETERTMLKNIGKRTDKTCIIVTHRPAALDLADTVVHVDKGLLGYEKKEGSV